MLVAQKDTITKITGIIMPESIDNLENNLDGAFTILKSTHFNKDQQNGFLANGYTTGKIPHRNQRSYVGLRSARKSGGLCSWGTRCQRKRGTT
jgi:hypothetical protein